MHNTWELLKNCLLKLRNDHGAVAEFCRKSGIPRQTIEYWLKDKSIPGIERLDDIAKGLGKEPWELIRPPSRVPGDLLAAIERLDELQYGALKAIVDALLNPKKHLEFDSENHKPRVKR